MRLKLLGLEAGNLWLGLSPTLIFGCGTCQLSNFRDSRVCAPYACLLDDLEAGKGEERRWSRVVELERGFGGANMGTMKSVTSL